MISIMNCTNGNPVMSSSSSVTLTEEETTTITTTPDLIDNYTNTETTTTNSSNVSSVCTSLTNLKKSVEDEDNDICDLNDNGGHKPRPTITPPPPTTTTNNNIESHENQNFILSKESTITSTRATPPSPLTIEPSRSPKVQTPPTHDEAVYDNSGVDTEEFIRKTLVENPKDREFMLYIEKLLISFLNDEKQKYYKFEPMNTYHRMLVHRIGAYFFLGHNVDQNKQCVVVNKTDKSRIPILTFQMCIPLSEASDESKPVTSVSNGEQTSKQSTTTEQIKPQQASTGNSLHSMSKKQILKREYTDNDLNSKQNKYNGSSKANEVKPKTYEEKSADYIKAKNRIFNQNGGAITATAPQTQTVKAIYTNKQSQPSVNNTNSATFNSNNARTASLGNKVNNYTSLGNNKAPPQQQQHPPQPQQYTILNRNNSQLNKKTIAGKNGKSPINPIGPGNANGLSYNKNQGSGATGAVGSGSGTSSSANGTNNNKVYQSVKTQQPPPPPPPPPAAAPQQPQPHHIQQQQLQNNNNIQLAQQQQQQLQHVQLAHYQQLSHMHQQPVPAPPPPQPALSQLSSTPQQLLHPQQATAVAHHQFIQAAYPTPVYSPTNFPHTIEHNIPQPPPQPPHDIQYHLQHLSLNPDSANTLQYYNHHHVQSQNTQIPYYHIPQAAQYVHFMPFTNPQQPPQQQQTSSIGGLNANQSNILYKNDPTQLYVNTTPSTVTAATSVSMQPTATTTTTANIQPLVAVGQQQQAYSLHSNTNSQYSQIAAPATQQPQHKYIYNNSNTPSNKNNFNKMPQQLPLQQQQQQQQPQQQQYPLLSPANTTPYQIVNVNHQMYQPQAIQQAPQPQHTTYSTVGTYQQQMKQPSQYTQQQQPQYDQNYANNSRVQQQQPNNDTHSVSRTNTNRQQSNRLQPTQQQQTAGNLFNLYQKTFSNQTLAVAANFYQQQQQQPQQQAQQTQMQVYGQQQQQQNSYQNNKVNKNVANNKTTNKTFHSRPQQQQHTPYNRYQNNRHNYQITNKSCSKSPPKIVEKTPTPPPPATVAAAVAAVGEVYLQMYDFKSGLTKNELDAGLLQNYSSYINGILYFEKCPNEKLVEMSISENEYLLNLSRNENVFVLLKFKNNDYLNNFYNLFHNNVGDDVDVGNSSSGNGGGLKGLFKLKNFKSDNFIF